jgi:phage protein D
VPEITYLLTVNGQAAPPELVDAVQRVEVEEHAAMASIMRLTFGIAVAEGGQQWTVVDEGLFPRLGEVALAIKVGSAEPEPIVTAYVIEARATFSEVPGESSLDVVAMDATVLMNLTEQVRPWPNMADSDVAESIFGDYGLTPVVERTQPTRNEDDVVPVQRGTDIQHLWALADRHGYDVFVVSTPTGVEGHFHPPRSDEPPQGVLTVGFGGAGNVASLAVTHDGLRSTNARGDQLVAESGESQSATVESSSLSDLGEASVIGGHQPRTTLLSGAGVATAAELQAYAQAVVDRSAWAVRAEGELSTMRYGGVLRARRPVSVRGVGQQLSGTYYVERVLHAFTEDGYAQHFRLLRNALGLSGRESFAEAGELAS